MVSKTSALLLALLLVPVQLAAQLRPLDPLDASLFDSGREGGAWAGLAYLRGQRAALAGVEGTLVEVGTVGLNWRTGRVVLSAGGTVLRLFEDARVFREPTGDARPPSGERRIDAGDFRVSTAVRLLGDERRLLGVRFGTRLPTTDNRVGLERDQTDFFALLVGSGRRSAVRGWAELGVGIHGMRVQRFEQVDVALYSLSVWREGWLAPSLQVVGHWDGLRGWTLPGIEDLGEVRAGLRVGRTRWLRLDAVAGYEAFSPRWGVLLRGGADW